MHILVVNDDGPPSPHSSPYVHSFVRELQSAGHTVSVCLPNTQRSWIGKAHMIGQTVKPSYYRPPPLSQPAAGLEPAAPEDDEKAAAAAAAAASSAHGTVHARPSSQPGTEEWVLVDGTPASCAQIGLFHFFQDRGPVDLVVSGPNYGRNTTAVFALSSGTLGGALEAALCGRRRAVALSFAFFSRNHDPAVIAAASRQSVRVIEALVRQWPADGSVDVYSVNVPLLEGVEGSKVLWTEMLQNYWGEGSCFTAVEAAVETEDEAEERIREGESGETASVNAENPAPHAHRHFLWSPKFTDVYQSVETSPPGNDGWAIRQGFTSVTPLKANFWHPAAHLHGQELKLDNVSASCQAPTTMFANMPDGPLVNRAGETKRRLYAVIAYEDDYVQPLILSAMRSLFPPDTWTLLPHAPSSSEPYSLGVLLHREQAPEGSKILQITQYERIDFEHAILHPRTSLINSYMIRKALIRKHFLSATVDNWVAKHPDSVLRTHVKRSEAFEVDFAEFLDDALVEAFDLRASLERNAALEASGGRTCDDGCLAVGTGQNQLDREPLSASDRPQVRISASLLSGASKAPGAHDGREWWILKPGMSDQGQGIRLFSTMDELQAIFDEWDAELTGSVDEDEGEEEGAQLSVPERGAAAETVQRLNEGHGDREDEHDGDEGKGHHCITASHLRHFVAQRYIHPPLLLPGLGFRKFHIRTYVLALGSLRVYVYRDMLALFAAKPYQPPSIPARRTTGDGDGDDEVAVGSTSTIDLEAHLTNTCLQTGRDGGSDNLADSVHRFWDLPFSSTGQAESIFEQITQVTGELFEAAARGMMVHFQPLESAFEVFGLDFLVDSTGTAWLLEANAFPDFKQTGQKLHGVVAQFWTEVLRLAVRPFLGDEWAGDGGEEGGTERGKVDGERTLGESGGMVLVKEVDLGRR